MLPLLVVCFYEKWEKMGWKSIGDMAGIEEARDDIRHGRVTEYDSDGLKIYAKFFGVYIRLSYLCSIND